MLLLIHISFTCFSKLYFYFGDSLSIRAGSFEQPGTLLFNNVLLTYACAFAIIGICFGS